VEVSGEPDGIEARATALADALIDSYGIVAANRKPLIHLLHLEIKAAVHAVVTPSSDPVIATIRALCAGTNVTQSEISGRTREHRVTKVRHAVWVSLSDQGFSSTEIAKRFDRDHTTVLSGLKKARANGVQHK